MKWTDNHIALLQQAVTHKHDLKALAAELGSTAEALRYRKCIMGMTAETNFTALPKRPRVKRGSLEVANKVLALIQQGFTINEIADQVGSSGPYITRLAKAHGVTVQPANRTFWTADRQALLVKLSQEGVSAAEIAVQMGVTASAIDNARFRFKVETNYRAPNPEAVPDRPCRICGVVRPITEFHKWGKGATSETGGGRVSQCKTCHNARSVLRRHATRTLPTDMCAGCGDPAQVVDHSHTLGVDPVTPHGVDKVRGHLCTPCNMALGQFHDHPASLRAVRAYLAKPGTGFLVPECPTSAVGYADGTDQAGAARLRTYGVTPQQVSDIMDSQGGRCGICDKVMEIGNRAEHLDHNHATGEIRGFLCHGCNKGLGCLKDSSEVADKLALYLENPPGATVRPVLDRITGLTEILTSLLSGVGTFTEAPLPYGLQGWQHGQELLVILLDPLTHNQQTFESRQELVFRRSARSALTNLVGGLRSEFGRVVVALPDMLTPALAHSLRHTLKVGVRTVFARKTQVREVASQDAFKFLADYHLQGGCYATTRLGLYQGDELVALMTFTSAATIRSEGGVLLQRFCTSCSVPGGASRLLAHYRAAHQGSIVSFSDDGYAQGGLYPTLGFTPGEEPTPTYMYWFDGKLHAKSTCQQPVLLTRALKSGIQGLSQRPTETELANRLGYFRVYLPGRRKWTLT